MNSEQPFNVILFDYQIGTFSWRTVIVRASAVFLITESESRANCHETAPPQDFSPDNTGCGTKKFIFMF